MPACNGITSGRRAFRLQITDVICPVWTRRTFRVLYCMGEGSAGIHLSTADRMNGDIRQQISHVPSAKISTSFHAWNEISHDSTDYGYVFISPVFDSISKTSYQAAVDLRGLGVLRRKFEDKERHCPRIVALGGVDSPHLPILKQYKFDGAAIYGAIWKSAHPDAVFERILAAAHY